MGVAMEASGVARQRLERALAEDWLTLYCQPILDLRSNAYSLAEILVRMRDEEHALLPPGEFLSIFEELRLMPQLDRWVVRQTLRRFESGCRIPRLSINLSAQTLAAPAFSAFVAEALAAGNQAPEVLLFELDEADIAINPQSAVATANALKHEGCGVIIDSFGASEHSLSYLKHLRVDMLKLDGSVVRKLLSGGGARSFVETVVRIAAAVGMDVIGSSVEAQDVLLRLKALGVGYAQGFGIHEPVPVDKIA